MDKSPDAFRTISEVAEDLDLPQHVLRFWETRFNQIKPLKRGGGRRYYRPDDIELLKGIRHLLYGEGYTIKGVQRILKTEGIRFVQSVGRGEQIVDAPERRSRSTMPRPLRRSAGTTSSPSRCPRRPRRMRPRPLRAAYARGSCRISALSRRGAVLRPREGRPYRGVILGLDQRISGRKGALEPRRDP